MSRCMIIEKSGVVRKVAKRILSSPEQYVVEADSADKALVMCEAQMPDTILIEASPAGMALDDFVRAIRAMQTDVKPLIIVSMIELDLVVMTRAKRAGADDYLLKPFDRQLLLGRFKEFTRAA